MLESDALPVEPGALLGHRLDGRPIHLIAGGSGDQPQTEQAGEDGPVPDSQQSADPVTEPGAEPVTDSGADRVREPVNPDAKTITELPNWVQDELRRARREAVDFRTQLREAQRSADAAAKQDGPGADEVAEKVRTEFAQQIGKALGLITEADSAEVDPQEVIGRLTSEKEATAKERDLERDRHRRALVELAVHRASGKLAADPDALLDSRSFLRNITDLDPDADGFQTSLDEAITTAIESNPKFKALASAGPPQRSGGDFTGGSGGRSSDPEEMTIDDFRKRRKQQQKSPS